MLGPLYGKLELRRKSGTAAAETGGSLARFADKVRGQQLSVSFINSSSPSSSSSQRFPFSGAREAREESLEISSRTKPAVANLH
ncbi:hypothetical protein MHYP_G00228890 [Metynnis hypsauchen]